MMNHVYLANRDASYPRLRSVSNITHTHSLSHTQNSYNYIMIYSIYHYISPFASLPIQHLKSEKITNAAEVLSRALGARSLVEPFWWSLPKGIRVFDDHNWVKGLPPHAHWWQRSMQWLFDAFWNSRFMDIK